MCNSLFTFYSQKYKVVCQVHHFVQNCTDSSKLSQTTETLALRSVKKIKGRHEQSVICEMGFSNTQVPLRMFHQEESINYT